MCSEGFKDRPYRGRTPLVRRQVMHDGDGDGEVKAPSGMRQFQNVGDTDTMRLVLLGDCDQIGGTRWRAKSILMNRVAGRN